MNKLEFIKRIKYSPHIEASLYDLIRQYSVVHLYDVPAEKEYSRFYAELAQSIGYFIAKEEDPNTGQVSDDAWTTIKYVPEKANTYKHSNTRQPLHTDYSYIPFNLDVTFFYCEHQARFGGATTFLDPQLLVTLLQEFKPELYQKLTTRDVHLGRSDDPLINNTVQVINFDEEGLIINWNYYRVSTDNNQEVLDMAEEFQQFLEQMVVGGGLTVPVQLKRGEAVFIRDKRLLHGRNAFLGNRHLCKGAIAIHNIEETKQAMEGH